MINTFKYVSCTDGKISVRIKIGITCIFKFCRHPIQVVVFSPVGLSSFLRHLLQVLLSAEVPLTVNCLSQVTKGTLTPNKTYKRRSKNNERRTGKKHHYLNGTTVKHKNKGNSDFDSNGNCT